MVQKKKQLNIQKTKTPHSNGLFHIDPNEFKKDVLRLIDKYSPGNISYISAGKKDIGEEGFYLVMINRNENLGDDRLQISAFGQNMSSIDLAASFQNILFDIENKSDEPLNYA